MLESIRKHCGPADKDAELVKLGSKYLGNVKNFLEKISATRFSKQCPTSFATQFSSSSSTTHFCDKKFRRGCKKMLLMCGWMPEDFGRATILLGNENKLMDTTGKNNQAASHFLCQFLQDG